MKQKARKVNKSKPTAAQRARMAEAYIAELEKRGELDPKHGLGFDGLLDDVAPPAKKKKPTAKTVK